MRPRKTMILRRILRCSMPMPIWATCARKSPAGGATLYVAGVGIGELSLGDGFRDLLPWSLIDNRPFLRCFHGYGLSLWRLHKVEEARAGFERMLWLNPTDNQGARFHLADIAAGQTGG